MPGKHGKKTIKQPKKRMGGGQAKKINYSKGGQAKKTGKSKK